MIAELGEGAGRVPGVGAPSKHLAVASQPRDHRRPGPVADLVELVAGVTQCGAAARVPASFWLAAGVSVAAGHGARHPSRRELTAWSLGR
ncbi:hypothetical protein PSMK_p00740 (plasmid) [Phycisphaera mikurensis NBRC 102666]|uniref:Uncharacterized protein n=1 Tax=Phycisphaera mikurensis (strain NBRC 102666 / KCTC 22515 / FYK2301M01) TaxID=1142394 RepID=I0IJJ8_PHYMF|nr:hypothetical protein PSMK_p00740 [Phycisphaera mikurensis NBRC 102666]